MLLSPPTFPLAFEECGIGEEVGRLSCVKGGTLHDIFWKMKDMHTHKEMEGVGEGGQDHSLQIEDFTLALGLCLLHLLLPQKQEHSGVVTVRQGGGAKEIPLGEGG